MEVGLPDMSISERQIIKQVNKIVTCLTKCKNSRQLLEEIHTIIGEMINAENFYVVLLNEDGALHFPYFIDSVDAFSEDSLNKLSIDDIQSSLTFFALTSNIACNFTKPEIEQLQNESIVNVVGSLPEQWMCFPLICDESYLGAFVIQSYRRQDEYDQDAIELLKAISHVVSSAMVAFNIQEELYYANTSLKAYQEKLEALIELRTQTIESKKKKLEQEIKQRKELQQELENKVFELQQQIKKNEELSDQMEHQATHDHLTGLANRLELSNVLIRLGAKMRRSPYSCHLMFIDLDDFKLVNDTLGHDAGDLVLVEVSERLKRLVRGYDLIARIGGDEFVILLENISSDEVVAEIGHRIINTLGQPIDVADERAQIGASIGVAYSCTEQDTKNLVVNADQAMYEAKHLGKGGLVWYSDMEPGQSEAQS